MSPLAIEILLHYYASPEDHAIVRDNPPVWAGLRGFLLGEQLLLQVPYSPGSACYRIGPRAVAWIEHVNELPLPAWRMS